MAEGRSEQLWYIASHIMATIANSNRWGGQPVHPDKFNPHKQQSQALAPPTKAEVKESFAALKAVFVKPKE